MSNAFDVDLDEEELRIRKKLHPGSARFGYGRTVAVVQEIKRDLWQLLRQIDRLRARRVNI